MLPTRRHALLAIAAAPWGGWLAARPLSAAEANPNQVGTSSAIAAESFTPSAEFQAFITALAREQLPDKYEKTKNWGQTTRVFDGWKVERHGLKIETRRRWKEANDGGWQMYRVDLVEPEKHFDVRIENVRQTGTKVACDVAVVAAAHVLGRHTQWESGVQLVSVSAEAEAKLRLVATVEIGMSLDPAKFPPDLCLIPEVTSADIHVLQFRLRRVSHFHGPVVKSLSATVREVLEDKVADSREKLVASLNKSLAKQQDKLRLSLADALNSPWKQVVEKNIPASSAR